MKNTDISVLMSVYRKENPVFFQEAIDSTLEQTLLPSEIVLVLDGPITIELQSVINRSKKKTDIPIKIISLKNNQGLGIALAKGVEACSYELIARMDTDDVMKRNRLEKQYQIFLNNNNLSIIGSNIDEFSGDISNVIGRRIVPESNEDIKKFSKRRNPFNHMTVMFKRSAVLKVGNYQSLKGFEDYYLWVRLLKRGYRGTNIQESLVYARGGSDMYSRRGGKRYFQYGLQGRKLIYKEGFGKIHDFLISIFGHIIVSILPNDFRGFIYESILRKK